MKKTFAALALAAAVSAAGCSAVSSSHVDPSSGRTPSGLHYAVPKALFRIELFDRDGELLLGVSRPILVGDPDATYVLNASSGLLASQEYLFVVEPDTRLLTYINSVSEGEAGAIIENIARGFGAAEGYSYGSESSRGGRGDLVIYSKIVDPLAFEGCDYGTACTFTAVGSELRARALDYLACGEARNEFQIWMCGRINANPNYFTITLEPMFAKGRGHSAAPADCRKSVCYRAPAPYRMSLRVAGVTDVSEMVLLPNEGPVMSMAIPAGVFADAKARMELYQGMPASYAVDRHNELLAITLLPAAIVKGFLNAVSEVFQLRINLNSRQADVLESETALDDAEDAREDYLSSRSTRSGLLGDAPESSRDLSSESSRPMDDPRGQLTGSQGAAVSKPDNDPGPLFEVPLARRAADAPRSSGQELDQ